jgi:membrane protease YdiL (CAAX protease family)
MSDPEFQDDWERAADAEHRAYAERPPAALLDDARAGRYGEYYQLWRAIAARTTLHDAGAVLIDVLRRDAPYLVRYHAAAALIQLLGTTTFEPVDLSADRPDRAANLDALGRMVQAHHRHGRLPRDGGSAWLLTAFFALTYAVSWTLWAAAAGAGASFRELLFLPGTIAPAVVALVLTQLVDGRAGVRTLLRSIVHLPIGLRWYVFAVGYMAAVKGVVAALHRVATGAWPMFGDTTVLVIAGAILVSTPVQAGEELGWRGYALPRLARRLGLAWASIVLGAIWAAWHLPLFFIAATGTTGQSFPAYALGVTALSVAMAWLYWRTGGSLLLVMLMHAAINNTAGLVRTPDVPGHPFSLDAPLTAWLTAGVLWVPATFLLARMRRGVSS